MIYFSMQDDQSKTSGDADVILQSNNYKIQHRDARKKGMTHYAVPHNRNIDYSCYKYSINVNDDFVSLLI